MLVSHLAIFGPPVGLGPMGGVLPWRALHTSPSHLPPPSNGCLSHLGFTPADQWSGATPRHLAATFPANSGLSHLANALSAHLRALRIAPRIISQAQKISRLILRSLYLWLLYHCVKFQLQLAEVILTLELQLERKHKLVQNSYQVV